MNLERELLRRAELAASRTTLPRVHDEGVIFADFTPVPKVIGPAILIFVLSLRYISLVCATCAVPLMARVEAAPSI